MEGTKIAFKNSVRFDRQKQRRRVELQQKYCLPAVMPPFGQPEFTIAVKTMWGHVVWNPPCNLGQTPVLISFKSVTPHQPGLRTQDAGWDVALDQNRLALREPIPLVLSIGHSSSSRRCSLLDLVLKDKGCCSHPFFQPTLCYHNHWS